MMLTFSRITRDFLKIASLTAVLTVSGCSWMNPFQWFKRDLACGPDDPASELNVACAKEKPKRSGEEKQRLICMSDGTEEGWVCGASVDEALSELAKQNPDVLGRGPGEVSTSDPALDRETAPIQILQRQAQGDRSPTPGETAAAPQSSDRATRLDQTSDATDIVSPDNERKRASTLEADQSFSTNTPKDVWVVGSFKSLSLAERFAAGFDRAFDLRTTILESDQDAEGNTWFRVSIERPGSEAARASLRQALEELGLERPWRLVINGSQAQALPMMTDALDAMSKAESSSPVSSDVEPVENEIISRGFAADNAQAEHPLAGADTTSPEPSVTSPSKSSQIAGVDEFPLAPEATLQVETARIFNDTQGSSTPQGTEVGTPDRLNPEPRLTMLAVRQNSTPVADPNEAIDHRPLRDEVPSVSKNAPVAALYTEQPAAQADDQAAVGATSSSAVPGAESVDLSSPGIPADAVATRPSKHEQTSISDLLIESENGPEVLQPVNETDMAKSLTSDKQTLPAPLNASIALTTAQSSIKDIDEGVIDQANSETIAVEEPANESPEVDLGVADGSELSPSNTNRFLMSRLWHRPNSVLVQPKQSPQRVRAIQI